MTPASPSDQGTPIGSVAGLWFEPRGILRDDRGAVLHYLREDSTLLPRLGEVYASTIYQGRVKAWKRHRRIAQNLVLAVGAIRFVAYDDRPGSSTHGSLAELILDPSHHGVLHVSAGIWYGFQGLAPGESMLVNCIAEIHDPAESDRLPEDSPKIPYCWPAILSAGQS